MSNKPELNKRKHTQGISRIMESTKSANRNNIAGTQILDSVEPTLCGQSIVYPLTEKQYRQLYAAILRSQNDSTTALHEAIELKELIANARQ